MKKATMAMEKERERRRKNWHAEAHEHVKQSYTRKKIERRTLNIKFLHYFCHILIDDVYTASFASSRTSVQVITIEGFEAGDNDEKTHFVAWSC